jgi:hypothetical protein
MAQMNNIQPHGVIYANPAQIKFLMAQVPRKTFNGGRGEGKTRVLGHHNRHKFNFLPKCKSGLASLTYGQLLNNCLPEMVGAWRDCGLIEYDPETKLGHYVIGKKPPQPWVQPYAPPRDYKHCITFLNGYTIIMLSFERTEIFRGHNLDALDIDESAFINKEELDKTLIPTVRGNIFKEVHKHWLHHSICDFTSAPYLAEGQWIYETEALMEKDPKRYFFLSSTLNNYKVLGKQYYINAAETMTKLRFDVEILNKRLVMVENCFYPNFQKKKHVDEFVYAYDEGDKGMFVKGYTDYNPNDMLLISFDFNANFMSCIIAQLKPNNELRIIDECFVKHSTIDALIDKLCQTYTTHNQKIVQIYGDRNGYNIDKKSATSQSYYNRIQELLSVNGWASDLKAMYGIIEHQNKYQVLNYGLLEGNNQMPRVRINAVKCFNLVLSITNSPIKPNFEKDKGSEQADIPQERATHFSDCFDYLYYLLCTRLLAGSESAGDVGFI